METKPVVDEYETTKAELEAIATKFGKENLRVDFLMFRGTTERFLFIDKTIQDAYMIPPHVLEFFKVNLGKGFMDNFTAATPDENLNPYSPLEF